VHSPNHYASLLGRVCDHPTLLPLMMMSKWQGRRIHFSAADAELLECGHGWPVTPTQATHTQLTPVLRLRLDKEPADRPT